MGRLLEAEPAHGLAADGRIGGWDPAHDRLVPRAPRQAMRLLGTVAGAGSLVGGSGCAGDGADRPRRVGTATCHPPGPPAPTLGRVATATVTVPGQPYSVVATRSGRWSFASLPDAIAVMRDDGFAPRLVRTIP